MIDMEITFSGGGAINDVMQKLPERLRGNVAAGALRAGANVMREEIVRRAPVNKKCRKTFKGKRYRTLRENIRVTATHTGAEGATVTIHTNAAFWGMFSEYGTSKKSARPFFRPAIDATADAALEEIRKYLESRIAREVKSLQRAFAKGGIKKSVWKKFT
ncbi:MAG: HK97-gp10 family putative phage morphogenesis protein [Rickettsiales bacterium]